MERDDFHTVMLVQLGDDGGDRFTSGVLDEALRQALQLYSHAAPRLLSGTLTLTGAGQMQSLAALSGLIEVVEVVFPYDAAASLSTVRMPSRGSLPGGMVLPCCGWAASPFRRRVRCCT